MPYLINLKEKEKESKKIDGTKSSLEWSEL